MADERADQIGDGGEHDRLPWREDFRRNDGGDRVRGIVETVDELERQRDEDDDEDERHEGAAQEFLYAIWVATLPTSRQRSMTFSKRSYNLEVISTSSGSYFPE